MAGDDAVLHIKPSCRESIRTWGFRRRRCRRPHPADGRAGALKRSRWRGGGARSLAVVIALASFSALAERSVALESVTNVNLTSIATTQHPTVVERALKYVGVPYRWGGSTPAGFDCSGFVRYIYAKAGIVLPRTAAAQFQVGTPVRRADLRSGDVVFFDGQRHNGIYIGQGKLIHASTGSRRVKISRLDDPWFEKRWGGGRRVKPLRTRDRLVHARGYRPNMIERAARRRVERSEQQCPRDRESRATSPRRKREDRSGGTRTSRISGYGWQNPAIKAVLAQAAGVEFCPLRGERRQGSIGPRAPTQSTPHAPRLFRTRTNAFDRSTC